MKNYYFDAKNWTVGFDKAENTVTIHPVTMLLLAPMLGASFVLFLPVVGFALIIWYKVIKPIKGVFMKSGDKVMS